MRIFIHNLDKGKKKTLYDIEIAYFFTKKYQKLTDIEKGTLDEFPFNKFYLK